MQFPVLRTKVAGLTKDFDLSTPETRRPYFEAKVGKEIAKLRQYLAKNSLLINIVGKKNSGKGTYTKMFLEAVGVKATQLAVGDIVRANQIERTMDKLLPTEKILEILREEAKKGFLPTVFLDGLPRNVDQIAHAITIRNHLSLGPGRDLFVLIDIPEEVMDGRMKSRVICPICKTPRSPKLLLTKFVQYDSKNNEFFLECDNETCERVRMVPKEGDHLGIGPIRSRLKGDEEVMRAIAELPAVETVFLSASIPVEMSHQVDSYEIQQQYEHRWDEKAGKVISTSENWLFKDDSGKDSLTLFPPAVTVYMIREMVRVLRI